MVRSLYILILVSFLAAGVSGQSFRERLEKVKQIKVLESTREDVRRILADYVTSEDNEYEQSYTSEEIDVEVYFSNGTCSEDQDPDDFSSVWKTSEWTVVRIEVEPNDSESSARDGGFDISRMVKEQRYQGSPDQLIYHDKARGVAVEMDEDRIEKIVFYPGKDRARKLCNESAATRDFYTRKSWFSKPLAKRFVCELVNEHANVEDLILSATEVEATTGKTINVSTVAVDPENDVLTYNYVVSAGRIIGSGAKVVWDLSDAKRGDHTITVGVDDGAGIVGKTVTKTVIVK